MKIHLARVALLALPLIALVPANAAINPAVVPADARWVIYADLNALRNSTLGKEAIAMAEKAEITIPTGKVGVDWQKLLATVGTATAYGTNISKDPKDIDGTLVIQGTPELRKIAESILIQANLGNPKDVAELTDLPFSAYALKPGAKAKEGDKNAAPMEVIIAFPQEPIIIVSKSRAQILKARDTFTGAAPSLAKASTAPLKQFIATAGDAYFFGANTVPADEYFPADGPQARIFKMTKASSVGLGERGLDTFAHVTFVASDSQSADKMMKIVQGMTAMMSLAETNDKQLADFLNSAAVERTGDTVTLDVAYSSTHLAQMVHNLQQQQQPRGQEPAAARAAQMINGRSLAEWQAEVKAAAPGEGVTPLVTRTIENVALKNGTVITLARQSNGGNVVRFDRVEISPAGGAGTPLIFSAGYMRTGGARGNWQQFQFPGADGSYTLRVVYATDPQGKATFAVSARDPRGEAPAPTPSLSPMIPEPKITK